MGLATGGLSITVTVTVFRAAWAGGRVSQKTFFVFWEPIVRVGPIAAFEAKNMRAPASANGSASCLGHNTLAAS